MPKNSKSIGKKTVKPQTTLLTVKGGKPKKSTKLNSFTRVPVWQQAFLASYADLGIITAACEAAKVDRTTVWNRKQSNKEFAKLYEEAHQKACDSLEREAIRRGRDGFDRPVYQGGALVGTERVYSDNLLTTLLKAKMPEVYRENSKVEVSGLLSFNALAEKAANVNRKDLEIKNNPALTGEV